MGNTRMTTAQAGTSDAAWSRLRFAEPGDWVEAEEIPPSPAAPEGQHVVHLLWSRTVDAESNTSFYRSVFRLETALAVQNNSQWQIQFDPRFQHLTLHWLRVVRDGVGTDHRQRDRMRLIQREQGLERHVLSGAWTLLVVLDDVRAGDVIDVGYSLTWQHPISAGHCESFFAVPPQWLIVRYRMRVLLPTTRRGMASRASNDAPPRQELAGPSGSVVWEWAGSQTVPRTPEPSQPGDVLDYIWVHLSDFSDWSEVASRLCAAWEAQTAAPANAAAPAFERPARIDPAAVLRLIRYVQDEYRYFSLDLATGGWIPATPEVVAERRYGDCKDLVWLAAFILRQWGVTARPVLVGSHFRAGVRRLLPSLGGFNHAVLEVELPEARRWFDLTLDGQGGDYRTQPVPDFAVGLPVVVGGTLTEQPKSVPTNRCAVRESIFLGTRNNEPSTVEYRLCATGFEAERLRLWRAAKGPERFAEERLQLATKRYGKTARVGSLQWRDDRDRDVCELVDTFEIRSVMTVSEDRKRVIYDVPFSFALQIAPLPEEKPRRTAWALAEGMEFRHRVVLHARSMGYRGKFSRKWVNSWFTATAEDVRPPGEWSRCIRMHVTGKQVPPEELPEYRRVLADVYRVAGWRIFLPRQGSKPSLPKDLGQLPKSPAGIDDYVAAPDVSTIPDAVIGQEPKLDSKDRFRIRLSRARVSMRNRRYLIWVGIALAFFLLRACTTS